MIVPLRSVFMSSQEIVDKMESVWQALGSFCEGLSEPEWKTPTDCPGWSVQDQLSHLSGSESRLLGRPARGKLYRFFLKFSIGFSYNSIFNNLTVSHSCL